MKILIGADIVPTATNIALFSNGEAEALIGKELLDIFKSADFRIFNLEVPLTDTPDPIYKFGPSLIAPTSTINGYKSLGIDCLTLANNHIMDQGHTGLISTIQALEKNDIAYLGVGESLELASKPFICEIDGKKIGIYACAEHEFSIAEVDKPGANPFDPLESLDHISYLKKTCDFLIVLYHGGKEHYRYPSPQLQKVCRKMVEKGADLVVCQHSHCIGCEEKYQNGTIVYGQGNFLFDKSNNECWQTSLLIQIGNDFEISYFPLKKESNTVRLAHDNNAKAILDGFGKRSEEIKNSETIKQLYTEYAQELSHGYLASLSTINTKNIIIRILNKLSKYKFLKLILKIKYKKAKLARIKNCIECEAHRELFLAYLNNTID